MKKQEYEETKASAANDKNNMKIVPYNFFFARVLQASAQTTVELCQMLKIPDDT
jgi:hypothetical protein